MFFIRNFIKAVESIERPLDVLNQIEISKKAVIFNYQYLKSFVDDIWPVIKSNAYGHGYKEIVQILNKENPAYFVADSYYDALKIMPYTNIKILILGYNPVGNILKIDFRKVAITIHDISTLKVLLGLKRRINIHLMVDTGMNRDGLRMEDLSKALELLKNQNYINLEGVFSHLADADGKTDKYVNKQINSFEKVLEEIKRQGFLPKYIHLANSFGIFKTKKLNWQNVARSGIGIYGFGDANLKPALSFVSTLVQKKEIRRGDKVSYNCAFAAPSDMTIGLVPVGYYEGVDHHLSNKGHFYFKDMPLKIIGKVCMNLTVVDLTTCADKIEEGEQIEIISNKKERLNSVENIAKICNTIPYAVTTRLAESIRRVVVK